MNFRYFSGTKFMCFLVLIAIEKTNIYSNKADISPLFLRFLFLKLISMG